MGTIEEIQRMQEQGVAEQDIQKTLVSQGISEAEAREALAQSKIKEAVMNPAMDVSSDNREEMQPSMITKENTSPSQQSVSQSAYPEQSPEYQYPQYEPYTGNISSDVVNEVAEQIIVEKLSPLKDKIERALDFKNIIDTKVEYIDERLKRMEKTIDRLQLSVLQKVGDYMTNVDDIKNELLETQKSFKALLPQLSNTIKPVVPTITLNPPSSKILPAEHQATS
ncbi:MAG: hypothetical protein AABY00_03545 [Nanoarchaeota archaeon]